MTKKDENGGWRLDKHIPIASLAALVLQTIAITAWLSAFYTQQLNNQIRNDERFANMTDQRKAADAKFDAMQNTQTQILTQLAALNEDIHELLHTKR